MRCGGRLRRRLAPIRRSSEEILSAAQIRQFRNTFAVDSSFEAHEKQETPRLLPACVGSGN